MLKRGLAAGCETAHAFPFPLRNQRSAGVPRSCRATEALYLLPLYTKKRDQPRVFRITVTACFLRVAGRMGPDEKNDFRQLDVPPQRPCNASTTLPNMRTSGSLTLGSCETSTNSTGRMYAVTVPKKCQS